MAEGMKHCVIFADSSGKFIYNHLRHMNSSDRTVKGIVPEKWKLSTIIPIPKGDDQSNVTNLRPISLLPLPGKMLERIVHSHISNHLDTNNILSDLHLDTNNILSDLQGGYRKNFSTIQTISDFTDEIAKDRNVGRVTGAIFIDLKKHTIQLTMIYC